MGARASQPAKLSADQVDEIEGFVDGIIDTVTRDGETLAAALVAIPSVPHECIAELHRFLVKLNLVRQATGRILGELREPGTRHLQ